MDPRLPGEASVWKPGVYLDRGLALQAGSARRSDRPRDDAIPELQLRVRALLVAELGQLEDGTEEVLLQEPVLEFLSVDR